MIELGRERSGLFWADIEVAPLQALGPTAVVSCLSAGFPGLTHYMEKVAV